MGAPGPTAARPGRHVSAFVSSLPQTAGVAALLVGTLVLLGWLADVAILIRPFPGTVATNPTTAVALALVGAALLLRERSAVLGRACAWAAAAIGTARLVYPIDTLLFSERIHSASGAWLSRMGVNTAAVCLLAGTALALVDMPVPRARQAARHVTLAALLLTLLGLVGHAYGSDPLHGLGMSLYTAAAFTVVCLGILCTHPGEGLAGALTSDTPGGAMARRLMPAVFLVPFILGWLCLVGQRAGWFDTSTGTALFAVALIVVLVALVYSGARMLDRSEARTRDVQVFLDSIVENVPDMIFVKEAGDLRFVRFNRAGEALLGFSRADLIGKNDFDFFPKDEAEFFTAKDRAALLGEGVVDIPEEPIKTRHGTRYLHTKKVAIKNEAGEPVYLLGISEDITERKAAQAELLRSRSI